MVPDKKNSSTQILNCFPGLTDTIETVFKKNYLSLWVFNSNYFILGSGRYLSLEGGKHGNLREKLAEGRNQHLLARKITSTTEKAKKVIEEAEKALESFGMQFLHSPLNLSLFRIWHRLNWFVIPIRRPSLHATRNGASSISSSQQSAQFPKKENLS